MSLDMSGRLWHSLCLFLLALIEDPGGSCSDAHLQRPQEWQTWCDWVPELMSDFFLDEKCNQLLMLSLVTGSNVLSCSTSVGEMVIPSVLTLTFPVNPPSPRPISFLTVAWETFPPFWPSSTACIHHRELCYISPTLYLVCLPAHQNCPGRGKFLPLPHPLWWPRAIAYLKGGWHDKEPNLNST